MKKLFVAFLTVMMLLGISVNSLAVSANSLGVFCPKNVEVNISAPAKVNSGELVTFTAVTKKHGSEFTDKWIGAEKVSTVLTDDGYYVSTAQVTARESVTVQYDITMRSASGVCFRGQASTAIEVESDDPVKVAGAIVKNITPVTWATGFYSGDKFALLSDGTLIESGSIYFSMSETETSKDIIVSVMVDGIEYQFVVTVTKP